MNLMLKPALSLIKKLIISILLILVIIFLVNIVIEGKYLPFLKNYIQFLFNKFLAAVNLLEKRLTKP